MRGRVFQIQHVREKSRRTSVFKDGRAMGRGIRRQFTCQDRGGGEVEVERPLDFRIGVKGSARGVVGPSKMWGS